MQVEARLRDQLAVLEGVRALYQSDDTASGFGVRSYLAALQPRVRAPGMQGVGIAVAMRRATPAAAEQRLRDNYGQPIRVWPATDQPIGFPIVLIEPNDPPNHEIGRASCKERVCQYVQLPLVAGNINKKKKK